jgi:hypothetical protein
MGMVRQVIIPTNILRKMGVLCSPMIGVKKEKFVGFTKLKDIKKKLR